MLQLRSFTHLEAPRCWRCVLGTRVKQTKRTSQSSSRRLPLVAVHATGSGADGHQGHHQQATSTQAPASVPIAAGDPADQQALSHGGEQAEEEAAQEDEQVQEGLQQQESEYIEVEVTTEVEEEAPPFNAQETLQSVGTFLTVDNVGRVVSVGAIGLLLLTLGLALQRVYQRSNTAEAKRKRLIERNKMLVTELSKYLPEKRDTLTAGIVRGLRGSTGFTGTEVFRKFLWYVLRLRKFDHDAVQDLLALKAAAGLSDAEVAEALQVRAQKVYDTYGTLMLDTEGFTTAGLERRTACKALFQKLLFLSECEGLVAQGSEAAKSIDLRTIFGATEEDLEKARLVSLYDVDLEKAFSQGLTGQVLDTESEEEDKPPPAAAKGT